MFLKHVFVRPKLGCNCNLGTAALGPFEWVTDFGCVFLRCPLKWWFPLWFAPPPPTPHKRNKTQKRGTRLLRCPFLVPPASTFIQPRTVHREELLGKTSLQLFSSGLGPAWTQRRMPLGAGECQLDLEMQLLPPGRPLPFLDRLAHFLVSEAVFWILLNVAMVCCHQDGFQLDGFPWRVVGRFFWRPLGRSRVWQAIALLGSSKRGDGF